MRTVVKAEGGATHPTTRARFARRYSVVILAMMLVWTLSGCGPQEEPTSSVQPNRATTTVSLGGRPELPADFVERIDGSTATIPLTTAALQLLRGSDDGLHHNTTDNAYNNLIAGTKDVIFVTAPSPDELAAAAAANVGLDVIPVVKDALVFLANTANPVTSLTRQQVLDIYTGTTTNWNQVGGADSPILPYQRPVNSGSQTLFLQLAMVGVPPMAPPEETVVASMDQLVDAVSQYDNAANALGYSVFYYAQQMYTRDNVKLLAIDGVVPSVTTIADGSYPYPTYYYAVIRSDEPAGSLARQLIGWLQSAEAQQMASSLGYVPLLATNIVPIAPQYGYHGSTPENTTKSSGTGGSVGWLPDTADPCAQTRCLRGGPVYDESTGLWRNEPVVVSIPGFPEAEAAAQIWADSLPEPSMYSDCREAICYRSFPLWSVYSKQGLFAITRDVVWSQEAPVPLSRDSAVFRLSDGNRLTLSDLFYDGVNYIAFMNQHLLDPGANSAWSDCLATWQLNCNPGELVAPFTGLPSDYDLFNFRYDGRFSLTFPVGNPFLAVIDQATNQQVNAVVPFNLPADLSPYGFYWRLERVSVGTVQVEHIIRASTGPTPVDDLINQAIDALAAEHPSNTAVKTRVANGIVTVSTTIESQDHFYANFDYATGQRLS